MTNMKNILMIILSMVCMWATAQTTTDVPSKLITNSNGACQLIVNDKPFIMIGGELHNSTCSTVDYMSQQWPKIKSLNLNTVLAAVAWEQIEPHEGKFDFTLVDSMIAGAQKYGMKLVILWFGSWKNGESSYAPIWVKHDTKRFVRVQNKEGKELETLSPFCENTRNADAKAFKMLMAHIRQVDVQQGTVIAVQPENEVGIFLDQDYSKLGQKAFKQQVPVELLRYMKANEGTLREGLRNHWTEAGNKNEGTWSEVFGDNIWAKSYCMAWQYASYIEYVAFQGRKEYNLPMFCNCWLVQNNEQLPGDYPNGGPVDRVHDIWKAAAPSIDVLCPDIYLPDFKGIAAAYHRHDNPLLIPEATMNPGNAFYAFGEHHALCYSPFGIEDGVGNFVFAEAYKVLGNLMPVITKYQGDSRMIGILSDGKETERLVEMGDYQLRIELDKKPSASYGIIIQTADNEFLVAGINFKVTVSSTKRGKIGYIEQVWEGSYQDGKWIPLRLLNGDETYHNAVLLAKGRQNFTTEATNDYSAKHSNEIFVYSPETYKSVWTPGIYRMTVYTR